MGESKLKEFHEWINTIHPNIKFTMSFDDGSSGIEYLDTLVYIKDGQIQTTLFTKPSDTHAYLGPSSCHPKHVCMNIPKGVAQRVRRICSEESEYLKHKDIMIQHFVDRGFNRDFIKCEFDKCDTLDREDLIGDPEVVFALPETQGARRFPLVLDFHPSLAGASKALNKYKHLLTLDENLKEVIQPDSLFVTFRKAKTLGDMLVHSRYPCKQTNTESPPGSYNCNKCVLCKNYMTTNCDTILSKSFGTTCKIYQAITCTDKHVIYCIDDLVCDKQNVGSTDDTMRIRFANHKSHIKSNQKSCRVACHFNEHTSHKWDKDKIDATLPLELRVTLIDKVIPEPWDTKESITKKLKDKESYWQHRIGSLEADGGLNVRNERVIANNKSPA